MLETYSSSLSLVRRLLASRLQLDESAIKDTDRFDDLGLTPLDVALIVLRLRRGSPRYVAFPVHALDLATTVGDLARIVEIWLQPREATQGMAAPERKE